MILPRKVVTRFPNASVMIMKVEVGLLVILSVPTIRPLSVTSRTYLGPIALAGLLHVPRTDITLNSPAFSGEGF
jgi:hypothetical protein